MITFLRDEHGAHHSAGPDTPEKSFGPNLKAVKKPIPIGARQVFDDFEVHTLEGTMKGKPGDYLMVGVNGEMYPCDRAIFEKTYEWEIIEE